MLDVGSKKIQVHRIDAWIDRICQFTYQPLPEDAVDTALEHRVLHTNPISFTDCCNTGKAARTRSIGSGNVIGHDDIHC